VRAAITGVGPPLPWECIKRDIGAFSHCRQAKRFIQSIPWTTPAGESGARPRFSLDADLQIFVQAKAESVLR
jgi:hypothetical protein